MNKEEMRLEELSENYVRNPGDCPVCGSWHILGEKVKTEDYNRASREMHCVVCKNRWFAKFALTGVEMVLPLKEVAE